MTLALSFGVKEVDGLRTYLGDCVSRLGDLMQEREEKSR